MNTSKCRIKKLAYYRLICHKKLYHADGKVDKINITFLINICHHKKWDELSFPWRGHFDFAHAGEREWRQKISSTKIRSRKASDFLHSMVISTRREGQKCSA